MVTGRDKVEQVLQAGTVECLDPCHPSQTKVELTPENSGCFLLTSWTQGN